MSHINSNLNSESNHDINPTQNKFSKEMEIIDVHKSNQTLFSNYIRNAKSLSHPIYLHTKPRGTVGTIQNQGNQSLISKTLNQYLVETESEPTRNMKRTNMQDSSPLNRNNEQNDEDPSERIPKRRKLNDEEDHSE